MFTCNDNVRIAIRKVSDSTYSYLRNMSLLHNTAGDRIKSNRYFDAMSRLYSDRGVGLGLRTMDYLAYWDMRESEET